jgi:hypothetical protein
MAQSPIHQNLASPCQGTAPSQSLPSKYQLLRANNRSNKPRVSVILLDWGVRESFHSLHYLNNQSVPRDQYELIWIEFYDRKPPKLVHMVENEAALDKWLVMGHPSDVSYHKHRMYNAGIVLAAGDICVICDSDAIFTPTFISSILQAFTDTPNAVIHLDEVRNNSKRFYPFNYPPLAQVLGKGAFNWTGSTTTGLDGCADMLHEANYGACMAARRTDLIAIGGADEHLDYLGYICGPYELTFRLTNYKRQERWLKREFLYHVWHPNTSGCNIECKGPDDGRGISLRALEARDSGRVKPYHENPAIPQLREHPEESLATMLSALISDKDAGWRLRRTEDDANPRLVLEGYYGFNLIEYRNGWYGLGQAEGEFDPKKLQNQEYGRCYSAPTLDQLLALLADRPRGLRAHIGKLLRRLPLPYRVKRYGRRLLRKLVRPAKT